MHDSVVPKQPEPVVQPRPTPPLPAEAPSLLGPHHVPPHLLLDPVLDIAKAPARVPDPEIVHPAADDRVDQLDYPVYRLGDKAAEDLLELPQECRPRFQLWRVLW